MHPLATGRSMPVSAARRSPRPLNYARALIASALCGSLLALALAEATSPGGELPGSPRVAFKSNNHGDSSDPLLVGVGAGAGVTPAGKAGLYVPLTKRPRSDGPAYGVDVGEGGISRRRLEGAGVGIEEGGERIDILPVLSFGTVFDFYCFWCCLICAKLVVNSRRARAGLCETRAAYSSST